MFTVGCPEPLQLMGNVANLTTLVQTNHRLKRFTVSSNYKGMWAIVYLKATTLAMMQTILSPVAVWSRD